MHVHIDQLHAHLKKNAFAPVYLISGDEPLQRQQAEDTIRAAAQATHDPIERVVLHAAPGFDWGIVQHITTNRSLFSDMQLLELRLTGRVDKEAAGILIQCAEKRSTKNILILSMNKVEKKTQQAAWFKTLAKIGVVIQVWPIDLAQLPKWITKQVAQKGKCIDIDAARLIAERVEGNLIAAQQEIDKLCLFSTDERIDVEQCISMVAEHPRYNVFSLLESSLAGQSQRTLKMLTGLRSEGVEPLALYGAIMWALRQLYTLSYQRDRGHSTAQIRVWGINKTTVGAFLKRQDTIHIEQLFYQAIQLERKIKSADKIDTWDQLTLLLLQLAGIPFSSAGNIN